MSVTGDAETSSLSSSSIELDPLLKDLSERKQSFTRNVVSLAAELKDARRRLALKEKSVAQEALTRKVVETKARDMEQEIGRLQKCLQEKDEKLNLSISDRQQYLKEVDDLRFQLSATQDMAEASALSDKSAQVQCLNLLRELDEKNASLKENEIRVTRLAKELDILQKDLHARELSQRQLRDEVVRIEKEIMHAVEIAGTNQDCELRKILAEVSPKKFENINKLLLTKDEEVARLRDEIRTLSSHWKHKTGELESKLEKHCRADQELKKRVMKLDFCLQEARAHVRKLQRMGEKRDKAIEELRDQLALKQLNSYGSCKEEQNFWESSGFKFAVTMSMFVLVAFTKR